MLILLVITPSALLAAANSAWDCKLADDGETWDCSISADSIKKTQPTPSIISQQTKGSKSTTQPKKTTTSTGLSTIKRVRLAEKQPLKQTAKAAIPSTSNLKKTEDWNCVANADKTWDCSQRKPVMLAKPQPKESGEWRCAANDTGSWDCKQTTEPSLVAATSVATEPETIINHTISEHLLKQMAAQLPADPWQSCNAPLAGQQTISKPVKSQREYANTDIQANYAELLDQSTAFFSGDVSITRADQQLTADQATYVDADGLVDASGDVFYQEKGFALHSRQATLQLNNNTGQFNANHFILEDSRARGTTQVTRIINKDITKSTNATYSTCKPGETDWQLEAKKLELNNITGRGTARDVWVEFFDIPFLYTPYISFPIDDRRQSGWLTPTFGSSDTTGVDLAIPYYWNITENYDATFTPRMMSNRGFMLGSEFRYLSKNSNGQVSAEIIEDTDLSKTRGQFSFQDSTRFSKRLTTLINLNYLSDDDYIDDFGNSLSVSSSRYIKSVAELNYRANNWNLLTKIDNYDSIDRNISSATRPHRRLPQILFNLRPTDILGRGKLDMRHEFTYFDHSSRTKGKRLDIHPGISFPYHTPSSFLIPRLSVRHTEYQLDNQAAGISDRQHRTLPILSLDSGLFFERELNIANGLIQTLEPRAFYLYVPRESQDDIPLFDSSEYDFSFNQLFRDNRFSGADRVADANQVTLALTSRFLESNSGKERLRASIGSIIYFDDLDVTLTPTNKPITANTSDIVAELSSKITDHWSARSALQYDPHSSKTQKATLGFHYRNGDKKLFNATYRSRFEATSDDIEQTDISFKWPLSKTWSSVGRWNYSEEHNLTLESFLGLEKDTCCWRFRVIARRYVNDAFDEKPTQGLFFQLELKGLSSFGEKLDSFLEEGILGYRPPKN